MQCLLHRQPSQCVLAMQLATGVIVAALHINDDMIGTAGDLKFTKCSYYRTGFRCAISMETGHGFKGLQSGWDTGGVGSAAGVWVTGYRPARRLSQKQCSR